MAIPSNLRAVIADDAAVTRRLLVRLLGELGVQIVGQAENGVEAVQRCLTLDPDLLVSDLVMPKLTGVDVIRLVKTKLSVRIIIVTSHCDKGMHARCLAIGADSVLIKPVGIEELRHTLLALFREPRPSSSPGGPMNPGDPHQP